MTTAEERKWLIERVRFAYETAGLPWPNDTHRGPVRLDRLMESFQLRHNELSGLTRTAALQFMARCGAQPPDLEGVRWSQRGDTVDRFTALCSDWNGLVTCATLRARDASGLAIDAANR